MLRVTIELVPFGMESMARTISEICIANVGGDEKENTANYEIAGYEHTDGKITELAWKLNNFSREDGALELVRQILSSEQIELEKVNLAEKLLAHTRLLAEEGTNE
jgi:hypothetical protein